MIQTCVQNLKKIEGPPWRLICRILGAGSLKYIYLYEKYIQHSEQILVLLVLGTTVNCLAVMRRRFWLFCLSCGHFCHFGKCIFVSLKGIRSFCVLLLVSQLCSDTFPFAKQVCANGFPSLD